MILANHVWQVINVETALIMDTVKEAKSVWQIMCVVQKLFHLSQLPVYAVEKDQFFILISIGI